MAHRNFRDVPLNDSRRTPMLREQDFPSQPVLENQFFTFDRKGDLQNVRFGEPDRYQTPKFRLDGRGRLLGLDGRYRIEGKSSSHSKRRVLDTSLDGGRRHHSTSLVTEAEPTLGNKPIPIKPLEQADDIALQENYILLGAKRRRLSGDYRDSDSSTETDLQQKLDFSVPGNSSGDRSSEAEGRQDYEQFRDDATHRRHLELQQATNQDPQDMDSWFSLISIQEDLFLSRAGEARQLTAKEQNIVCEVRISIYETAIKQISDRKSKEKLILGLVNDGSKVWDYSKQAEMWKFLLDKSTSLDLHVEFLNFLQSNTSSFSVDTCLDQYTQCFKIIQETPNAAADHDEKFSYLILRLTSFLVETGYLERAIGIWQALLELNFRKPASFSEDQMISRLEEFWNFDAPRIGEDGANGLDAIVWLRPVPVDDPKPPLLKDSQAVLKQWSQTERMLYEKCPLPARLLDGTSEDDPYRIVTFSDIKRFSCHLVSEPNLEFLIQAFLQFAALPPLIGSQLSGYRTWWTDPYCTTYNPVPTSSADENSRMTLPKPPFSHCLTDTAVLFGGRKDWFSPWKSGNPTFDTLFQFFKNVVVQLTTSQRLSNNPELFEIFAEYATALQLQHDLMRSRKLVKSLLKKHPENLRLYNAYAIIENRLGNNEASEKAWSVALSMNEDTSEKDVGEKILLWHTWILHYLNAGEDEKALYLMSIIPAQKADLLAFQNMASSTEMTPAVRLRTKQYLLSEYQIHLQSKDYRIAVLLADLLAIFAYLANGKDFNEMEQAYKLVFEDFSRSAHAQGSSILLEHLHQNHVQLVNLYASTSTSYRPRDVIRVLRHSYQQFPNNTIIWSLYRHHSQKAGLIDRLRDTSLTHTANPNLDLDDKGSYSNNDSHRAVAQLLSISSELSRPSYAGSTVHSIRAAFDRAAERTSPLYRSPAFWEAWLNWEIEEAASSVSHTLPVISKRAGKTGQDPLAAKYKYVLATFHSAMRACPWAKKLYMLVLGSEKLEEMLAFDEAKGVYDSMLERGLRVRYDVSDKLDDLF